MLYFEEDIRHKEIYYKGSKIIQLKVKEEY
jgi:hypothetical protein